MYFPQTVWVTAGVASLLNSPAKNRGSSTFSANFAEQFYAFQLVRHEEKVERRGRSIAQLVGFVRVTFKHPNMIILQY